MFGFYISKNGFDFFAKSLYVAIVVYFLMFGFIFSSNPYVKEIFLAIFILPFIPHLFKLNFSYDKFFGKFSYPIFISHFLVFYWVEKLGFSPGIKYYFCVFLIVLCFSFILIKIQDMIDKKREKFWN